jgi:hypothetical protein
MRIETVPGVVHFANNVVATLAVKAVTGLPGIGLIGGGAGDKRRGGTGRRHGLKKSAPVKNASQPHLPHAHHHCSRKI